MDTKSLTSYLFKHKAVLPRRQAGSMLEVLVMRDTTCRVTERPRAITFTDKKGPKSGIPKWVPL